MMDNSNLSMSHSIGDSVKSSFNDSNKTIKTEEMGDNYNSNIDIFKSNNIDGFNDNRDVYDVNYGLGSLDSFIKLKSTAKNIPVYKLLKIVEKEADITKNTLLEGKKERRMLESKLITSENNAIQCAQGLITKVVSDIDQFAKDMRKMIKQNMEVTTTISKELYDLNLEMKTLKQEYKSINSLLTEGEEKVGIIDYWTGYN